MQADFVDQIAKPEVDVNIPAWHWPDLNEGTFYAFLELAKLLAAAFALGVMVAGVYYLSTSRASRKADRSFLATLVLLSVLIALVTLVIGNSIARAFSLAGALAIIRFRTVVEDTRDTAFVIFSVASGMAVGANVPYAPLACAPFVLIGAWMLRGPYAGGSNVPAVLQIRLGAGRVPGPELQALLVSQLGPLHLLEAGTARGGAAFDIKYAIKMPPSEQAIAIVNNLSRFEGVQSVEIKES